MIIKEKHRFAQTSEYDKQNKIANQKFRPQPKKQLNHPQNWQDELKDAKDPDSLANLYIKNLKEGLSNLNSFIYKEIRLLESQSRVIKSQLGILNKDAKGLILIIIITKDIKLTSSAQQFYQSQMFMQNSKVAAGPLPSDFMKYPTKQDNIGSILVDNQTFGSSVAKVEYIRELENLIKDLSQQNQILTALLKQKQQGKEIIEGILFDFNLSYLVKKTSQQVKKFEGHDYIRKQNGEDLLLVGKLSPLIVQRDDSKMLISSTLYADNTLADRMIQNLLEEINSLEAEVALYKGISNKSQRIRPKSAVYGKKVKMEGYDFQPTIKFNTPASVVYGAKMQFNRAFRYQSHQSKKEKQEKEYKDVEDKYLQGLLQEQFLLNQQLSRLKEENKYYDPKKKKRNQ